MTCAHCASEVSPGSNFCGHCGHPLPAASPKPPKPGHGLLETVGSRLGSFANLEKLEGFSLRDMFSEVFKRRTSEEVLEIVKEFAIGLVAWYIVFGLVQQGLRQIKSVPSSATVANVPATA